MHGRGSCFLCERSEASSLSEMFRHRDHIPTLFVDTTFPCLHLHCRLYGGRARDRSRMHEPNKEESMRMLIGFTAVVALMPWAVSAAAETPVPANGASPRIDAVKKAGVLR